MFDSNDSNQKLDASFRAWCRGAVAIETGCEDERCG